MQNSLLKVLDIKKHFEKRIILDKISFELNKNEIFGLIGVNGAGKTTLINIILNLLNYDSGSVKIFDIDSTLPESRKNIKYLPENFQITSVLKGIEFLKIFSNFNELKNTEKLEKEIFSLCNILSFDKNFLNCYISKYSNGMLQKLGLISTFLGESNFIILDEPMNGLDIKARYDLKKLFLKSKNDGKTIFFTSHILSDIDELCDRIGILNNGKMSFIGTPLELKQKYTENSLEKAFLREII